jgi:hypothetical protein
LPLKIVVGIRQGAGSREQGEKGFSLMLDFNGGDTLNYSKNSDEDEFLTILKTAKFFIARFMNVPIFIN